MSAGTAEHNRTHAVAQATEYALEAFWQTVARSFPEITTGDLDPLADIGFRRVAEETVAAWVETNMPAPLTLAEAVDTLRYAHDALASFVMRTEPDYQPTAEERDNAQIVARMVARTLRRTGTYENPPRP